jgi:predicted transcriptional regulator
MADDDKGAGKTVSETTLTFDKPAAPQRYDVDAILKKRFERSLEEDRSRLAGRRRPARAQST